MRFSFFYKSLFTLLLLSFLPVFDAYSYTFLTNLRLGNQGNDIRELQKALNANENTRIAISGAGSPGNETDYFGILTKNAVMKFQELHRLEVLIPAGVSDPTGFVGALTRLKLNSLSSKQSIGPSPKSSLISLPEGVNAQIPTSSTTASQDLTKFINLFSEVRPEILGLSRYEAGRGDAVTVLGRGFLPTENKIHFGNSGVYITASSANSMELTLKIPETVPYDSYYLWIENKNGNSFVQNSGSFFTVSESPHLPPKVISVSPSSVSINSISSTKIKVFGENFTSSNNSIYSNLGTIESMSSSDGITIEFSIADFGRVQEIITLKKSVSSGTLIVPIITKTNYGVSSDRVNLVISF